MRSCFQILGALCAFFAVAAHAQNVIPNNRATPAPVVPETVPRVAAVGVVVSKDSKLIPGDEVSVKILEDNEDPWRTMITDTGEVDLNSLGSVQVSGKTAAEAEVIIGAYLRQRYYNKATVEFRILHKNPEMLRPDKVVVAGKVQRPGAQYFNDATPLKLSEAVIAAGTTAFSDLKRVQLTRGGVNTIYNVQDITKNGRTDLDVRLRNGDQVFVREAGWVFGTN